MEEFDLDVVLRLQSNKWIVYGVWRLQSLEEMVGKEMKFTQHDQSSRGGYYEYIYSMVLLDRRADENHACRNANTALMKLHSREMCCTEECCEKNKANSLSEKIVLCLKFGYCANLCTQLWSQPGAKE